MNTPLDNPKMVGKPPLISKESRDNKKVVLAAVAQNGLALQHASEKLKNDEDIVLAAVAQNGKAFKHASITLQHNERFFLKALKTHPSSDFFVPNQFKNDQRVRQILPTPLTLSYVKKLRELVPSPSPEPSLPLESTNDGNFGTTREEIFDETIDNSVHSHSSQDSFLKTPENGHQISMKETLKIALGIAAMTSSVLLLGRVIILPFNLSPALSLILSGCLLACAVVYTGYKLYQHRLSFFNCFPSTNEALLPQSLTRE